MLDQKLEADGVEEILQTTLADANGTVLVINPSAATLTALITTATAFDGDLPTLNVLASRDALKTVRDDFPVASHMAELCDRGTLEAHVTDDTFQTSAVVTDEAATALVRIGDGRVVGFDAANADVAADAFEFYADEFESYSTFSLRTPARSAVMDTLTDEFGDDVRADFADGIPEIARPNVEHVDEVMLALLVVAKHDGLLYDVSKWGDDVGVASKATFSRTKTSLEDRGLIQTEKKPIEVGRPRLRLQLNDDLQDADVTEIISTAESMYC